MLQISGYFHVILRKAHDGKLPPGHLDSPGLGGDHNFFAACLKYAPVVFDAEKTISLQRENRHTEEEISRQPKLLHNALRFRLIMRFLIGLMAFHSKLYENTAGPITRLLVVGLVVDDAAAPVDLLQQDHPHKLMGKSHCRKA